MPARFLLIDGYNLLHAAGMARQEYGPGDLQRCRERLLRYLAGKLTPAEIARTTVIFDARDPPPDRPNEVRMRGIQVLFANPGGDADVVIQEWLEKHSAPKRVTLVSSDRVLQRAARRARADFVDSEEFFERLERRRRPGGPHRDDSDAKPVDGLSAAEAAEWMRFFGDMAGLIDAEAAPHEPPTDAKSPPQAGRAKGKKGKPRTPTRAGRKPAKSSRKPRRKASTDDLAYWMDVFGNLPEAQELARGKSISQADLERWLAEHQSRKQ